MAKSNTKKKANAPAERIPFSEIEMLRLEKAQLKDQILKRDMAQNATGVAQIMTDFGARVGVNPAEYRIDFMDKSAVLAKA